MTPDLQTENCLACGEPARVYAGHVHRNRQTIIAGWCSPEHHTWMNEFGRRKALLNCTWDRKGTGCYGAWRKRDGVEPWE